MSPQATFPLEEQPCGAGGPTGRTGVLQAIRIRNGLGFAEVLSIAGSNQDKETVLLVLTQRPFYPIVTLALCNMI